MNETDKIKLREFENQFLPDIDNWCRWGKGRDYLPRSWGNIIGNRYRPRNRQAEREEAKKTVDTLKAFRMEKIVCDIPTIFRQSFVLHYVGRAAVNGKIRFAYTRDTCHRIIGISRAQHYNRLNRAAAIIARQWDKQ